MSNPPTDAESDARLLEFAHFVATKFVSSTEGWTYSRDLGTLKHVRYSTDYTGYNRIDRRVRRAFNLKKLWEGPRWGSPPSVRGRLLYAWARIVVSLRKSANLPDGQVNGNLTFWEEDGEYITLFGPTVGVEVIEFLRDDPEHPHARAILAEMHSVAQRSWPDEGDA